MFCKDLRICTDYGSGVQVVEKEEIEDTEATAETTAMTLTDAEQVRAANNGEQDAAADDDDDGEDNNDKVEAAIGQERQRMSVNQRIVSATLNKQKNKYKDFVQGMNLFKLQLS